MRILSLALLFNLLICNHISALIYNYALRKNSNKITMVIKHSRKKEVISLDFNKVDNWKKQLQKQQTIFQDEFGVLVDDLKKYKSIGSKSYDPSLFTSADVTIINIYNKLQEINMLLKKINSSIIMEEKYSISEQAKNIVFDPMIYTPQLIGGTFACMLMAINHRKTSSVFVKNGFLDYLLTFLIADQCKSIIPSYIFSAAILYMRHK